MSKEIIPQEFIASKIYIVRGHKVMLDSDLASLYGVTTKNLNKAVSRNLDSFPPDFMYKLKTSEQENLRFQIGTSRWVYQYFCLIPTRWNRLMWTARPRRVSA